MVGNCKKGHIRLHNWSFTPTNLCFWKQMVILRWQITFSNNDHTNLLTSSTWHTMQVIIIAAFRSKFFVTWPKLSISMLFYCTQTLEQRSYYVLIFGHVVFFTFISTFFSRDREWHLILEGVDPIEQIDLWGIFDAPLCVNMVLPHTGEANSLSR